MANKWPVFLLETFAACLPEECRLALQCVRRRERRQTDPGGRGEAARLRLECPILAKSEDSRIQESKNTRFRVEIRQLKSLPPAELSLAGSAGAQSGCQGAHIWRALAAAAACRLDSWHRPPPRVVLFVCLFVSCSPPLGCGRCAASYIIRCGASKCRRRGSRGRGGHFGEGLSELRRSRASRFVVNVGRRLVDDEPPR